MRKRLSLIRSFYHKYLILITTIYYIRLPPMEWRGNLNSDLWTKKLMFNWGRYELKLKDHICVIDMAIYIYIKRFLVSRTVKTRTVRARRRSRSCTGRRARASARAPRSSRGTWSRRSCGSASRRSTSPCCCRWAPRALTDIMPFTTLYKLYYNFYTL